MLLRPFFNDHGSCASYLFGCTSHNKLAVVDAHVDLVDEYLSTAAAIGSSIMAVFETHVQADHVSGLPELIARTGATAYLPAAAGVDFEHVSLVDGDVIEFGNTFVTAIATPGHAPAHHAYTVADRRRGTAPPLPPRPRAISVSMPTRSWATDRTRSSTSSIPTSNGHVVP